MQVSFECTREDYWRFYSQLSPYSSGFPALLAGLVLFLTMRLYRVSLLSSFSISVILALLTIPYFHYQIRRRVMAAPKSPSGYLGHRTVTVDPDFLHVTTLVGDSRTKWEGIWRIQDDADYIYLFLDATMAYVIPKRAFPSRDDSFQFVTACRQYRKAAVTALAGSADFA